MRDAIMRAGKGSSSEKNISIVLSQINLLLENFSEKLISRKKERKVLSKISGIFYLKSMKKISEIFSLTGREFCVKSFEIGSIAV